MHTELSKHTKLLKKSLSTGEGVTYECFISWLCLRGNAYMLYWTHPDGVFRNSKHLSRKDLYEPLSYSAKTDCVSALRRLYACFFFLYLCEQKLESFNIVGSWIGHKISFQGDLCRSLRTPSNPTNPTPGGLHKSWNSSKIKRDRIKRVSKIYW